MKHKIVKDFEIQMGHLIPTRRPDPVLINKKITCHQENFAALADNRVKIKGEQIKRNTKTLTKN